MPMVRFLALFEEIGPVSAPNRRRTPLPHSPLPRETGRNKGASQSTELEARSGGRGRGGAGVPSRRDAEHGGGVRTSLTASSASRGRRGENGRWMAGEAPVCSAIPGSHVFPGIPGGRKRHPSKVHDLSGIPLLGALMDQSQSWGAGMGSRNAICKFPFFLSDRRRVDNHG